MLNEPVKLNPGDQVILTGSVIGDGECRLESDFGYRVQVQEE